VATKGTESFINTSTCGPWLIPTVYSQRNWRYLVRSS